MVHFIRNSTNRTIIECQVSKDDLSASVNIKEFVNYLNDLHKWDRDSFTEDIHDLNEIRGWWWEYAKTVARYASIDDFVAEKFKEVVETHNENKEEDICLVYITD